MGIFKLFHSEVGWFFWGLVLVGVIWFWRGGTEYQSSHEPFIKPLAPLNTGETYGNTYLSRDKNSQRLDLPENPITTIRKFFSSFSGGVKPQATVIPLERPFFIDGEIGTKTTDPQKEYVRIVANYENKATYLISSSTLTGSAYVTKEIIPKAVNTLVLGSSTPATDIFVPAQGRVIVSTGKSPIGTSFRVNICSGYLGQFQSYTPELRAECPNPAEELKRYGPYNDISCRAFVETLPSCQSFNGTFPATLASACKKFVSEKLSYNSCVADHVKDEDFYKFEWRLFLGKDKELWKDKQEVIRLYDLKGNTVDAITY